MQKIPFEDTWLGMLSALVSLTLFTSSIAVIAAIVCGIVR